MHDCENGVMVISESEWPAFLYPKDMPPDIEDDRKGLFMGYMLTRVCPIVMRIYELIFLVGVSTHFYKPKVSNKPQCWKEGPCIQGTQA
jgi:hypothetical protein